MITLFCSFVVLWSSIPQTSPIKHPCVLIRIFLFFNHFPCLSLVKMHQRQTY